MNTKTRVLVVDDDRRMVKTISDILKVKGYDPLAAYTGEQAVEMVRNSAPDCVLMDIKMPGIDGVEALKMIRGISPDLPVVLMSAYATEEQTVEAKKEGAYSVLTKPIDIQMVLAFLSLLKRNESVLIVDDDPQFSRTLKDILQTRDYKVETELDPDKVLEHMENNYELVVVLDLKLGDKDGLDVLKDIRAKYPTKPVVLVTGYRDEMSSSIKNGFAVGAYTCLYKPFESETLIGLIEEISRKKRQAVLGEPFSGCPDEGKGEDKA
jgi:two-component system response regulator HydG